jgi:hypothetical protein
MAADIEVCRLMNLKTATDDTAAKLLIKGAAGRTVEIISMNETFSALLNTVPIMASSAANLAHNDSTAHGRDGSQRSRALIRSLGLSIIFLMAIELLPIVSTLAFARDFGQWAHTDPAINAWYEGLKQPDFPSLTCCGHSDAYWCDEIHVRDGKTYCNITDDRPDDPLVRPHIDIGTEVFIPDHKLKWDNGNPTGHAIVFMGKYGNVYCFVQSGGA